MSSSSSAVLMDLSWQGGSELRLTGSCSRSLPAVVEVEGVAVTVVATLVTDSKSLCETVQSTTVTKDKRAMVAIANLRRAGDQDLEVLWDSASRQLADCLTKGGPQVKPQELREVLQVGKLQLTGQKDPARMRRGQGQRK